MKKPKSLLALLGLITLVAGLTIQIVPFGTAFAAGQITNRSLTLVAGTTDGGSKPGGVVNHLFSFKVPTGGSVGSIQFKYCTTPADVGAQTCQMPTGLVTTSATLSSQSGATGFTIVNTTNGAPYLTRTAASITANTQLTYQLNTITNPTATNTTFFVRISDYTSTDTTGTAIDAGSVAASTANPISLTGVMPESLVFCTGATVGVTNSVPDCTTATAGNVSFSSLFSPTATSTATSQMAASTNAGSGYAITINGATLTSGSNTITAMSPATTSQLGHSQFGTNLVANTTASSNPAVGTAVTPAANGTNYRGQAMVGYNTADTFKYNSGDTIADSANGGAGGTDAQIFTNSYIVNVPGSQPAGTYTTTLTYICTPTF